MAMLAEPRQRKRYNILPRGKALYEDDSSFGSKMLAKMGWSKGKGLGAKENGNQEFVRVRYKNDAQGLGYEDRDDQWTQHEQSFSGLLQALNGSENEHSNSSGQNDRNNSDNEKTTTAGFGYSMVSKPKQCLVKLTATFSGESLEEKSKRSKVRVHYKKFTRGKDLSRYSEKDLANILGRKGMTAEEEQANNLYESLTAFNVMDEKSEKEKLSNEKNEDAEKSNLGGVHTVISQLSMGDYFKQKMEAIKNKIIKNATNNREFEGENEDVIQQVLEKSSREQDSNQLDVVEQEPKKRKKKKNSEALNIEKTEQLNDPKSSENENNKITKKRKNTEIASDIQLEEITEESTKKKKRKLQKVQSTKLCADQDNLKAQEQEPETDLKVEDSPDVSEVHDKRKRKKLKNKEKTGELEQLMLEDTLDAPPEIKSNKKSKINNIQLVTPEEVETDSSPDEDNYKDFIETVGKTPETKMALFKLPLDELKRKLESHNVYTISTFAAEKFRSTDLNLFTGANITHINGYSHTNELKLDIIQIKGDEKRITRFWDCTLSKYNNSVPKKTYWKYAKDFRKAKKAKAKLPRFNVKKWKRKQAFQGI